MINLSNFRTIWFDQSFQDIRHQFRHTLTESSQRLTETGKKCIKAIHRAQPYHEAKKVDRQVGIRMIHRFVRKAKGALKEGGGRSQIVLDTTSHKKNSLPYLQCKRLVLL